MIHLPAILAPPVSTYARKQANHFLFPSLISQLCVFCLERIRGIRSIRVIVILLTSLNLLSTFPYPQAWPVWVGPLYSTILVFHLLCYNLLPSRLIFRFNSLRDRTIPKIMNSTIYGPNVMAATELPTTTTLIPKGIALAVTAPLTCIIDLPPLIWHIRNRNTAAACLVGWVILGNLMNFLNLLIWPTDNFVNHYAGHGLCDVEVKIMVARAVALPASSLCIVRVLSNVMNTDKSIAIPTKAQRRRALVMELVWCLGLPLVVMCFHYIVQPNRYFLAGVAGCTPSFWASWLSIVLISIPPLLLSFGNAVYAGSSPPLRPPKALSVFAHIKKN